MRLHRAIPVLLLGSLLVACQTSAGGAVGGNGGGGGGGAGGSGGGGSGGGGSGGGGGGGGGSGGVGGGGGGGSSSPDMSVPDMSVPDMAGPLVWHKANLTNFESYPDPDSDECRLYHGCDYEGLFAFVDGQQSEAWVMAHNIIAVHSKDEQYALKTFRIKQGANQIDATVYDECADSDCSGCCTRNSQETGFLIDMEKYTMQRFGSGDGIVDWACLDCP
jgi:hypothetical protein